jgi:predicted dehydrogenase
LRQQTVKLAAVVEPTLQGRASAQGLMPHVPVFSHIDDLLKSLSVTFVDITAQPAAHCELILKAAAAGINVICEKPFVTSLEALHHIEQLRCSGGPIIAACHNWYFAPAIRRALELVTAGKIGEPQRFWFAARRSQPATGAEHWKPNWRQFTSEGGGILGDLGYHGFYLASRIFQSAPILVRASPTRIANNGEEAESAAYVQLDYGERRQAELTLSWVSAVRETSLEVHGSSGSLTVEGDTLSLRTIGKRDIKEQFESLTADSWHSAWIGDTLDWFIGAVESGDRNTCWRDILWSVSALNAAHDSMKSGVAVATSSLASPVPS